MTVYNLIKKYVINVGIKIISVLKGLKPIATDITIPGNKTPKMSSS